MVGVGQRDLDTLDRERAAFVGCVSPVLLDSLGREPATQLDLCDDRTAEPLVERDGVADVIVVAVCQEDEVAALGLDLVRRAARIAVQERVEVDALAAGRVDPERRVPEPGELSRHAENLEEAACSRTVSVRLHGPSSAVRRVVAAQAGVLTG